MKRFLALILATSFLSTSQATITKVETTKVTIPVMINRDYNQVLGLNIVNDQRPGKIKGFAISLKGSDLKDLESLSIHQASIDPKSGTVKIGGGPGQVIATTDFTNKNHKKYAVILKADFALKSGDNNFWVSVTPTKKANINHTITVELVRVESGSKVTKVTNSKSIQRIGYAVTTPNQEISIVKPITGKLVQKRNSKFFRIPGLTRTRKGTMIATFDNRYKQNGDLPADIDVAISRSTDGGQTWSPIITTIAAKDVPGIGRGCGDPAILFDPYVKPMGRIWIAGLAAPKTGHPIWKSVTGSTSPKNCGQIILAHSDDDGLTWSKPINITASVKRLADPDTKEWACLFQGPGNGIVMRNGTLVFPGQIWGKKHMGVLVYSKDRGKTWQSSKAMSFGGSESQVAELPDGSLMLNTREGAGGWRQVGGTKDMGETWTRHESVKTAEGRLRNPSCQGCLISVFNPKRKNRSQYNFGKNNDHLMFFSNPSAGSRFNMTVKFSKDAGNSWSKGLLYDQRKGMGYSAIYPVDANHLGVLYEGEHHYIYFLKFPFKDILEN